MELSPGELTIIVSVAMLILLASGMWISAALGLLGMGLLIFLVGGGRIGMIGLIHFNAINSFLLTCVPMFIFMGEVIMYSGQADRLYKGATSLVGFLPGGLLHTNIVACAFFAAVCGSSSVTAATIGTIAIPHIEGKGYNRRLLLGSLASAGTLGPLIPPSLVMIIYGATVGESVGKLFIAGVIPGIILTAFFMAYVVGVCSLRPSMTPERLKFSVVGLGRGLAELWQIIALALLIGVTIYAGLGTPTEAAAVGAFLSLVFCALNRKLTWDVLKKSALSALETTCWILLIVIGANIVSMALSALHLPAQLASMVTSLGLSRYVILSLVVLLYFILGCFIDGISMMLLTLAVVFPIITAAGFHPIWFGVVLVILIEIGCVTPPFGINLYIIHGISKGKDIMDVIIGMIPFLICMFILIFLLVLFPELVIWLPAHMG
jgi:tripartite ATP-independent transporter DctM subunit